MNPILEKVQRKWREGRIENLLPASDDVIQCFEAKYHIRLPPLVREYFAVLNGTRGGQCGADDEDLLGFWHLDQVYLLGEESGSLYDQKERLFVFADYSIQCWLYAVRLTSEEDPGPVFMVSGIAEKVTDNFAEFLTQYVKEGYAGVLPKNVRDKVKPVKSGVPSSISNPITRTEVKSSLWPAALMGVAVALLIVLVQSVYPWEAFHGVEFLLIGCLIGLAVRAGSSFKKSIKFQCLAVVIAYAAMAPMYLPKINREMHRVDAPWHEPPDHETKPVDLFGRLPPLPPLKIPADFRPQSAYDSGMILFTNIFRQRVRPLTFIGRLSAFRMMMVLFALSAPFLEARMAISNALPVVFGLGMAWLLSKKQI